MLVFKTKVFMRWADHEGVSDAALLAAVAEMNSGLVDANLGGQVFKKRVGIDGRGKRGGLRTLLAFRAEHQAFFVFGFAKSACANLSDKELAALKLLASKLLNRSARELRELRAAGEIFEVKRND